MPPDSNAVMTLPEFQPYKSPFSIAGTLEGATICEYDGTKVMNLERVEFET